MQIFVTHEMTEQNQQRLKSLSGDDAVHFYKDFPNDAPVHDAFLDAQILFGDIPADWLTQTQTLRWIQLGSVGFDKYVHLDWQSLSQQITVTNLAGFFAEWVAESALAGILALYRGIDDLVRFQQKAQWHKDALRARSRVVHGANVLLVGHGTINRRIAELLMPFECEVTALASDSTIPQLDAALPRADIVICATPETNSTRGLFDVARLSLMKDDAIFVNLGRGSIVNEQALIDRVTTGGGGAVLDVTEKEPLPEDHPFWTCQKILLMQHTGGGSVDELDRKIDVFIENLHRFRACKPLNNIVNWDRGY